jgi:hypothetical protein
VTCDMCYYTDATYSHAKHTISQQTLTTLPAFRGITLEGGTLLGVYPHLGCFSGRAPKFTAISRNNQYY